MVSDMFCTGGECTKSSPRSEIDKGIRAVFICCAVLAVVGLGWTYAFVDDTPHESLDKAENQELIEAEKPGEVETLEDKVLFLFRRARVCVCRLTDPSPLGPLHLNQFHPHTRVTQVVHGIELGVLKVPPGTCMSPSLYVQGRWNDSVHALTKHPKNYPCSPGYVIPPKVPSARAISVQ